MKNVNPVRNIEKVIEFFSLDKTTCKISNGVKLKIKQKKLFQQFCIFIPNLIRDAERNEV